MYFFVVLSFNEHILIIFSHYILNFLILSVLEPLSNLSMDLIDWFDICLEIRVVGFCLIGQLFILLYNSVLNCL